MELFESFRQRYSVRAFQKTPISESAITTILEAANSAPSAGNLQAYEIVIVRDAARKRELAKVSLDQFFLADAPVVLVFCANPDHHREKYGDRGLWEGSLYLFDARMHQEFSEDVVALGRCERCDGPTHQFYNCANLLCRKLILLCATCAVDNVSTNCRPEHAEL